MRTDPHCSTLATCDLVSTSPRDVGGFPFTDSQHPLITVATTRTKLRGENGAGLATHSEKIQQIQPNKHWTITHKEREDKEGQKSTGDVPHYKILIKCGSPDKRPKL